jgi:hypothetical protein
MQNKSEIFRALQLFGHLLPDNINVNYLTFADLIKQNYSLNNPVTWKYYNVVLLSGIKYCKKASENTVKV